MAFALKKKNYDDLTITDLISPRILILVVVPEEIGDWILLTQNELTLRRCAFWMSLVGQPPSLNEVSVTVRVPRNQPFTVESLNGLMERTDHGDPL